MKSEGRKENGTEYRPCQKGGRVNRPDFLEEQDHHEEESQGEPQEKEFINTDLRHGGFDNDECGSPEKSDKEQKQINKQLMGSRVQGVFSKENQRQP